MKAFTIYPAIDLKGGRCVRLRQGRADDETVYGTDPVAMARHWVEQGATWLHVVDLDGAFAGRPAQLDVVARIAAAAGVPVQCGGGLRTDEDVQRALDAGVRRVVLGTRAWADTQGLAALVARHGAHLAVGLDARDGMVQIKGWTETTNITAVALARQADELGVQTLIVTDTATDGMLKGTNLEAMSDVCSAVRCTVIASGGVARADDVTALRGLGARNLGGAIVGKALYEGHVTLPQLRAAAG